MKYKIGERVIVRPTLEVGKTYRGVLFTEEMSTMRRRSYPVYKYSTGNYLIGESPYLFSDEMLLRDVDYDFSMFHRTESSGMKFEPGDLVVVKSDLEVGKAYGGQYFLEGMDTARGKVYSIDSIDSCEGKTYVLKSHDYIFSEDMLRAPVSGEAVQIEGQPISVTNKSTRSHKKAIATLINEMDYIKGLYVDEDEESKKALLKEQIDDLNYSLNLLMNNERRN